jgi:SAM-dependent methyltransferase
MGMVGRVVPAPLLAPIKAAVRWWQGQPPVDGIDFGELRRLQPISRAFGTDRGQAIDRYFVERFLEVHQSDVRGRVLEIGDSTYTRRFGGDRVTKSDVLHVHDRNRQATIVGDLAHAPHIADASFDCIILTQVLQLVFDLPGAMRTLQRILAPGGTLLLTVPGISQVAATSEWGDTWYWAFTLQSVKRLLAESMPGCNVQIAFNGNVLASAAFLYGLAARELTEAELHSQDADYQLLITARVTKDRGSA